MHFLLLTTCPALYRTGQRLRLNVLFIAAATAHISSSFSLRSYPAISAISHASSKDISTYPLWMCSSSDMGTYVPMSPSSTQVRSFPHSNPFWMCSSFPFFQYLIILSPPSIDNLPGIPPGNAFNMCPHAALSPSPF